MSTKNSKEQVNIILLPFLKLDNETYLLDVSEDKATEMGGSKEDFQEVLNELEVLNNFVKDAKSDPKHEVTLFDPQKTEKATFAQPPMPSGRLSSNGQETVSAGFDTPHGATKVKFTCKANVAIAAGYTCRTHAFGITKTGTGTGSSFVNTEIVVGLAASNVPTSVDFRTTDPNGGVCLWEVQV